MAAWQRCAVTQLAPQLKMSQSTVSKHVRVLVDRDLLSKTREGRYRWCRRLIHPYEFTRKDDFGVETLLGKIFEIERNYEIRIAGFRAQAKRGVLWIGGNFSRGAHLDPFGSLSDQVDDFSDKTWTDAETLEDFLVLVQNVFSHQPNEMVPLAPPVEYIGTRIPTGNERLSEARYASHKHARVNDDPRIAFPSFLRQR